MQRSEPGACYDESPSCKEQATNQNCFSDHVGQSYANYCYMTCGLCQISPSTNNECFFHKEVNGFWRSFGHPRHHHYVFHGDGFDEKKSSFQSPYSLKDEQETDYFVSSGQVRVTSKNGNDVSHVCKSIHWYTWTYKVLSVFANGCRPRYSCLSFQRDHPGNLHMRFLKSVFKDVHFNELCYQQHNRPPNEHSTLLLAAGNMQSNDCGLHGSYSAKLTFSNQTHSHTLVAVASDLDNQNCTTNYISLIIPSINRTMTFRCRRKEEHDKDLDVLITTDSINDMCWVMIRCSDINHRTHTPNYERSNQHNTTKKVFIMVKIECTSSHVSLSSHHLKLCQDYSHTRPNSHIYKTLSKRFNIDNSRINYDFIISGGDDDDDSGYQFNMAKNKSYSSLVASKNRKWQLWKMELAQERDAQKICSSENNVRKPLKHIKIKPKYAQNNRKNQNKNEFTHKDPYNYNSSHHSSLTSHSTLVFLIASSTHFSF